MIITPKEASEIMEEIGMSQKKLSIKAQVNKSYINEWLNNRRLLNTDQLIRINEHLSKFLPIIKD